MKWRVGFFLLCSFLFACHSKYDNSNLSIFKYNESNGISTLDPAFSDDKATIWATSQIFSPLVKMNDNLEVVPLIARKWEISEDGKKYIFTLRKDVFFHDHSVFKNGKGRSVVASDFVYSFNRLLSEDLASSGSWVFNHVEDYYADNDSVVVIILKNPFPPFLSLLSMQYCSVVPQELVDRPEFRSRPIGTGPFKFQYWKEGVKLVLRKNENYFEKENGERLPKLDAVAITFIKDKQSEFLSFLQGEIDFISGIDPSYKDEILSKYGTLRDKYSEEINLQSIPFLNTEYLAFLMDGNSVLSGNKDLRKAINYAIDKKRMLKFLRNNIGVAAENGFVPKGMSSFSDSVKGYSFDKELSQKHLELAGYPNGDGLSPIVLNTTSSYLDLCEFIQSELKKIGVELVIEVNPSSTHRQMVATSKLNFFRASWIADYPDAQNYLSLFYSKDNWNKGLNKTHFQNEEFDMLYEKSIVESDFEKRTKMYQDLDQIIMNNAVIIPLYYDQTLRFSHKHIKGFSTNAQNTLELTKVVKE